MDEFQYYPTPPDLAKRAWRKFKNQSFTCLLEPSAGAGHLLSCSDEFIAKSRIDCCELDMSHHAILRENGYTVTGLDFLDMTNGAQYSHCLMNPPFAEGAKHVLKAWDLLWDGEIVAILNAQTIRNPFSVERQMLVSLIEQHGEVEFIEDAFQVAEAERKTSVEVALVWLRKEGDAQFDLDSLLYGLKRETETDPDIDVGGIHNEIMLPTTTVENAVRVFNSAVTTAYQAIIAEARAAYYADLLDCQPTAIGQLKDEGARVPQQTMAQMQAEFRTRRNKLKTKAWTNIIRGTEVTKRLTSAAQRQMEREIETLMQLEFTVQNIYGLFGGLIAKQGDMQNQVLCDVFDLITCYHSDNAVFYKGWRSNDRHRSAGWRIRTTRFILPGFKMERWQHRLSFRQQATLEDIDKAFALLDGASAPSYGLVAMFDNKLDELRQGKRCVSTYFELRYYPGIGTLHFFARSKTLVDRLNRFVGAMRKWIPPANAAVSPEFWVQYEDAEKFDKDLRAACARQDNYRTDSLAHVVRAYSEDLQNSYVLTVAQDRLDAALTQTLEARGLATEFMLDAPESHLALPAAA